MTPAARRPDLLAPAVRTLLAPLLESRRHGAAAFDADGTLWRGDVGEDLLRLLIAEDRLPRFGGRRDVYEEYERRVARDPAAGFRYAVEVMAGLDERELSAVARDFFQRLYSGRVFPFARMLIEELTSSGKDVWIVSASPVWPVIAGAEILGLPPARVLGVRCEIRDGLLTGEAIEPVPTLHGKVRVLAAQGVRPLIAAGNSVLDIPMLEAAEHAFVVAPRGEVTEITRIAQAHGWPIQWV
jgi:phosphatidylglycerophosphatase C